MSDKLSLTERELREIHHALWYATFGNHGTVGHNMLIIIAKMARYQGFYLIDEDSELVYPSYVENTDK